MRLKDPKFCLLIFIWTFSFLDAVEILPFHIEDTKKECYGTHNGLSMIGSPEYHYRRIRKIFGDCTYVIGNLEVTHLMDDEMFFDLDFLSEIEVVTGYVLIAMIGNITEFPLRSLKLIKGERMFEFQDVPYSLLILGTYLRELQLPELREISKGDVILVSNPFLCYVNTIHWEEITSHNVLTVESGEAGDCENCSVYCTDNSGYARCWGSGLYMCQTVHNLECDANCPGSPKLCHAEGIQGCCHPSCALGCFGPLDTQCLMCRDYRYGHTCLSVCPKKVTYPYAGHCIDV